MFDCIICNSNDFFKIAYPNAKDTLFVNTNVLVCEKCGFSRLDEVLQAEKLTKYYAENYGNVANRNKYRDIADYFANPMKMYKVERSLSQINLLFKYINIKNTKNILEIGPGLGTLCYLIKKYNKKIKYSVVEYEKQAINHMLFLRSEVFNSLGWIDDNSIDLIISSHSLEHYQYNELLDIVKQYYAKLKDNGLILLEVPLVDFVHNKTLQITQEHEPHTLFFTLKSLVKLFEQNGFEVLFLRTVGDFQTKNKLIRYFYKIQNKLIQNNIFLFEYGGNRRCIRAIFKKIS